MKIVRISKNCKKVLEDIEESFLIYKIHLRFQEISYANTVKIFFWIILDNFLEDYSANDGMFHVCSFVKVNIK